MVGFSGKSRTKSDYHWLCIGDVASAVRSFNNSRLCSAFFQRLWIGIDAKHVGCYRWIGDAVGFDCSIPSHWTCRTTGKDLSSLDCTIFFFAWKYICKATQSSLNMWQFGYLKSDNWEWKIAHKKIEKIILFSFQLLYIISTIGTTAGLSILSIYLMLQTRGYNVNAFNWLPIVSISFVVFIASCAILNLPFVVISEIMPEQLKNFGASLSLTLKWIFGFFIAKYFPFFMALLELYGTMFVFASFCLSGAVFVIWFLPETKGKSYEQIMNLIRWICIERKRHQIGDFHSEPFTLGCQNIFFSWLGTTVSIKQHKVHKEYDWNPD